MLQRYNPPIGAVEDNVTSFAAELGFNEDTAIANCLCENFATPHQGQIEPELRPEYNKIVFGVGIPANNIHVPFALTSELRPFTHDYNLTPGELSLAGLLAWMKLSRLQDTRGGIEFFSFTRYAINIGRSALLPEGVLRRDMTQTLRESGCPQFKFMGPHQPAGFR